jgi:curved DNA-binding protein CbpA
MLALEARLILELSIKDSMNPAMLNRVWRQKVRLVHPDKNNALGKSATEQTQVLNEARDVLISLLHNPMEKIRQDAENEKNAREKEKTELEATREREVEEKKRQGQFEARVKREKVKADLKAARQVVRAQKKEQKALEKQTKREHYEMNRRRRAPGTRMHRGIWGYKEGRALEKEFRTFFQNNFMHAPSKRVFYSDMLEMFIKSRDNTTELEKNLFRIHTRRLLFEAVPEAYHTAYTNRRCFLHVSEKNKEDSV